MIVIKPYFEILTHFSDGGIEELQKIERAAREVWISGRSPVSEANIHRNNKKDLEYFSNNELYWFGVRITNSISGNSICILESCFGLPPF